MVYDGVLEGRYVDLRSCTEDDAEFTRDIRKDPEFVRFLPAINNTVEDQKAWIRKQRKKDGDYFFVVWDKKGKRIGTISIYNVEGSGAESGRLAIKGSNPFQGVEAQLLIFRFAFGMLGLGFISGYIYSNNERAIRFNKQFGGVQSPPEKDENGNEIIRFIITSDVFEIVDKRISSILYREKKKEMNK